jgi:hypothetical protein
MNLGHCNPKIVLSDTQAAKYYDQGSWLLALQQNQHTLDLIGQVTPALAQNMAACYSKMCEPQQAVSWFTQYLALSTSKSPQDLRLLAQYLAQAGQLDQSENITASIDVECFEKYHDLATHFFRKQQWPWAFKSLSRGKQLGHQLWIGPVKWQKLPSVSRWQQESLQGKRICLVGECGLGDEIVFARWIPQVLAQAQQVDYLTDNSLDQVFHRQWPQLGIYSPDQDYDFWIPAMDVPQALQSWEPRTLPYLSPHPDYCEKWQEILKTPAYIAINWTGSRNFSENVFRDIPVDFLVEKIQQQWPSHAIVNICMETDYQPANTWDVRPHIKSWEDTLAVLSQATRLYTSCSSVAHAAGALGTTARVYTRPDDYFTWNSAASGHASIWHSSVQVWRTPHIGKWHQVIAESFQNDSF